MPQDRPAGYSPPTAQFPAAGEPPAYGMPGTVPPESGSRPGPQSGVPGAFGEPSRYGAATADESPAQAPANDDPDAAQDEQDAGGIPGTHQGGDDGETTQGTGYAAPPPPPD